MTKQQRSSPPPASSSLPCPSQNKTRCLSSSSRSLHSQQGCSVPLASPASSKYIYIYIFFMSAPTLALAGRTRVGWVGAGVMGRHMCAHLLAKGFKATIFSRTIAKAESLRLLGATLADSVAEVCRRTSLISSGALCASHSAGRAQQRRRVHHARPALRSRRRRPWADWLTAQPCSWIHCRRHVHLAS